MGLIAIPIILMLLSLAALLALSASLGVGMLALWSFVASRAWPRLRLLKGSTAPPTSALPLSLVVVPLAVALLQTALAEPVTRFSRSRAIRNSARMIADYFWFD